jgi:hypothetical protein
VVPPARARTAKRVRLSPTFERINVVGTSGSGKTTFARQLAARLDLPYYEMDALFWKPGWRFGVLPTVWRVAVRTFRRGLSQEELWPGTGNRESMAQALLSRKSIIWWAITTHGANRRKYNRLMSAPEYARISFIRLRSPGEARFLAAGEPLEAI